MLVAEIARASASPRMRDRMIVEGLKFLKNLTAQDLIALIQAADQQVEYLASEGEKLRA